MKATELVLFLQYFSGFVESVYVIMCHHEEGPPRGFVVKVIVQSPKRVYMERRLAMKPYSSPVDLAEWSVHMKSQNYEQNMFMRRIVAQP